MIWVLIWRGDRRNPTLPQIGGAIATHTGNAVATHAAPRTKVGGSAFLICVIQGHGNLHGRRC
jgi:hypothetical protein